MNMTRTSLLAALSAFGSGVVFAIGLAVSGMTMPKKVIGFLDVTGHWDPSLMFVMIGAIAVFAPAYRWIARRERPLLSDTLHVPEKAAVDLRLCVGAAVFGVGWGLVGLCPGPAVTALATGSTRVGVFFAAMLLGMALGRWGGSSFSSTRAVETAPYDDA